MSTENRSAVTVTNVTDGGDDVSTDFNTEVIVIDMSEELSENATRGPAQESGTGGQTTSGLANTDTSVDTVLAVGGNASVCVYCMGSGTSKPALKIFVNGKAKAPEQAVIVQAPTPSTAPNNQRRKVRRRSRLNRSRSGKKKRIARKVRAKGSGDTMATTPSHTPTSRPEVEVLRETSIDLKSSTDSGDDESSSDSEIWYSSGDRSRRRGRCVRFNKFIETNAAIASNGGRPIRRVLQKAGKRPPSRAHRIEQRPRKHRYSS